jgi:hypothetical protein
MAIICVTYDLKAPGRNYQALFNYLEGFVHCKRMESFWLLDTTYDPVTIRDNIRSLIDSNDVLFVAPIVRNWASLNFECAAWLKEPSRRW